ncbi:MAG: hypothetical protein HOH58_05460 [Opitutaceae bacterium]|jgi:hypothetical protein|nr:hypothetical protein [Opitutaceae bacterium]
MIRTTFITRLLKAGVIALSIIAVSPVTSFAQNTEAPKKEISDKASEALTKLQPLTDEKKWDEALNLINTTLVGVTPVSYDTMVLNQIKVQVLLTQEKYPEAIPPMEIAIRLGSTYDFMEKKQFLEFNQILSQLYFQEANEIKGTSPADKRQRGDYLSKAYQAIQVYLRENENPTEDSLSYAATMIYTQATMDDDQTDLKLLNEARTIAEKGILLSLKPRETFYVLILAALQQDEKNVEASEILELLVAQKPTNKQYWQQLQATYLALANDATEGSREALEWNFRTIHTIDRAQKLGILDEPRDYFNRVGILMNIQQFDQAIKYLREGIEIGKIEDTQKNWEYLATSYQQVNKEFEAIDALSTAAKKFPTEGEIDFRIANLYYVLDKLEDAYKSGTTALKKGNLNNRPAVLMFVAYMGYELKNFEEALPLAEEAKNLGAERAEGLVTAIQNSIEERKIALEADI